MISLKCYLVHSFFVFIEQFLLRLYLKTTKTLILQNLKCKGTIIYSYILYIYYILCVKTLHNKLGHLFGQ